jgi:hypothetical protein
MIADFYIDESGNTGDVLSTGDDFDFCGQPVFSLACIGIDDTQKLDEFISKLKEKYRVQSPELKCSKVYSKKPKFISDLIDFLGKENFPIFIEVVDKKYFITANLVNCHVMPAYTSPPETPESQMVRNHCADFIYYNAPISVFHKFIKACENPSNESLMDSFQEIRSFVKNYSPVNGLSKFIEKCIDESINDYNELKSANDNEAYLKFIPVPDSSKRGKSIWMLPNLSSFTNIYARINLYLGGNISTARIIHDEQVHFDEILTDNKKILEELDMSRAIVISTAKYSFSEKASLEFSESHQHSSIQVADILAGMAMRYMQEKIQGAVSSSEIVGAYNAILRMSNPYKGVGINLVTTGKIHHELHF